MDAVELQRQATAYVAAQKMGMKRFLSSPLYARAMGQGQFPSYLLKFPNDGTKGVDLTLWHPLQNAAGIPYFMAGVDFVGDPCHPIFGG